MSAVLRIEAANESFRRLETFPLDCQLHEIVFEMAADQVATPERMAGWLESANTEREPSKYFIGGISTEAAAALLFGRSATQEQREQAAILLRNRFVEEHMEEISRLAAETRRDS